MKNKFFILTLMLILMLFVSCSEPNFYKLEPKHNFEKQTNLDDVNTILVIGDSISFGMGGINEYGFIQMMKDEDIMKNVKVVNCSHGGDRTINGINQINKYKENFDMLIIHFGMNDGGWFDRTEYKNNLKSIIQYAKSKNENCKIVLISTLIPAFNRNEGHRIERIYEYEDVLYELKYEYENISVVPIMSYSIRKIKKGIIPTTYTLDGIHPNSIFHREMADYVLYTITK